MRSDGPKHRWQNSWVSATHLHYRGILCLPLPGRSEILNKSRLQQSYQTKTVFYFIYSQGQIVPYSLYFILQGIRKVPHYMDFKEFVQYGFRLSQNPFGKNIKSLWYRIFQTITVEIPLTKTKGAGDILDSQNCC